MSFSKECKLNAGGELTVGYEPNSMVEQNSV